MNTVQAKPTLEEVGPQRATRIVLAAAAFAATYATVRFFEQGPQSETGWALVVLCLFIVLSGVLFHFRKFRAAGHIFPSAVLAIGLVIGCQSGGIEAPIVHWIPFIPATAALTLGHRAIAPYGIATGLTVAVLAYVQFDLIRFFSVLGATAFATLYVGFYELNRFKDKNLLIERAMHDPLTGLPSRTMFDETLRRALARAKRRKSSIGLVFIDVDGLKEVNDRFGHVAGDNLLREVADRVSTATRDEERPFHLSGDEFVIVVDDSDEKSLAQLRHRLSELQQPLVWNDQQLSVSISIGTAMSDDKSTLASLTAEADKRMYEDKAQKRTRSSSPTPARLANYSSSK